MSVSGKYPTQPFTQATVAFFPLPSSWSSHVALYIIPLNSLFRGKAKTLDTKH